VKQTTGSYPRPSVDTSGRAAVGQAGGVLLTSTVKAAGLDVGLSAVLGPWRPAGATHDPAKVLLDLALTLALGGDTCSDLTRSAPRRVRRAHAQDPRHRDCRPAPAPRPCLPDHRRERPAVPSPRRPGGEPVELRTRVGDGQQWADPMAITGQNS